MSDDANNELAGAARKYWSAEGYTPGGVLREVDYAAASKGIDPRLKGIKIVDCDTHLNEPPDMLTGYAPASMKTQVHGVKRVNIGGPCVSRDRASAQHETNDNPQDKT